MGSRAAGNRATRCGGGQHASRCIWQPEKATRHFDSCVLCYRMRVSAPSAGTAEALGFNPVEHIVERRPRDATTYSSSGPRQKTKFVASDEPVTTRQRIFRNPRGVRGLIPIRFGFKRPFNRYAQILRLFFRKDRQLHTDLFQMQPRHLFVQLLRQRVHANLIDIAIGP
jgi:hypothetical protein